MTRANTEQIKYAPWFAKAGAACSIVPISRFIGPTIFALKGGGYGCLFALNGIDEEGLTDQELDSRMRSIEGALRGLPEGSCLYQYTRVMSGFELPRQKKYTNPVTQVFIDDRLDFLEEKAGFRRIDLQWCLTLEPSKLKAFERKPQENAADTSRMLVELQKAATILEGHLGSLLGLRLQDKNATLQFFSYLFNLEEWASQAQLRDDAGVDGRSSAIPSHGIAIICALANAMCRCIPLRPRQKHRGPASSPACSLWIAIASCARHGGPSPHPRPAAKSTHKRSSSRFSKSACLLA